MASNKDNYNTIAQNAITKCEAFAIMIKNYGNDGEILVKLNADISKEINTVELISKNTNEPLWTVINSIAVPLFVHKIYQLGNSKAIITFHDFQDNNITKLLLAKKLYSNKIIPQKENQHELINYKIVDNNSGKEFVVLDVIETKMNTILEVADNDNNEFTIPLAQQLVEIQNDKTKIIVMNLPDGLLDI